MAQLGNSTATRIRPYRARLGLGTYPIAYFQESTAVAGNGSSDCIRVGDVVQFDVNVATANHRVVRASTMANVPNLVSTAIIGIAANTPASTVTAASPGPEKGVAVYLATPGVEFLFPTKLSGATHVSSLAGGGRRCALAYDSTDNIFYADPANSTAGDASIIITEVIDAGTTNGLVVGRFISTNTARFVSAAF